MENSEKQNLKLTQYKIKYNMGLWQVIRGKKVMNEFASKKMAEIYCKKMNGEII